MYLRSFLLPFPFPSSFDPSLLEISISVSNNLARQNTSSLPNPAKHHPPNPPLHTLPRLQNPPIRRNKHALPRPRKPLDIPTLPRPRNLAQILTGQPNPPGRFTNQLHVPQHRLVIPILQPQPQSSLRRVLGNMDFVDVFGLEVGARRVGRRVGEPGFFLELGGHVGEGVWGGGCLEGNRFWGRGTPEDHAGDEAFALETEHEVDMQFGDGDGG